MSEPPPHASHTWTTPTRDGDAPQGRTTADGLRRNTALLPGPTENLSPLELAALVRAEQDRRWRRGERVPLEAYLRQYPVLGEHREAMAQLIFGEVRLRAESGESAQPEEFLRRFPDHEAELRRQFGLYRTYGSLDLVGPGGKMLTPPVPLAVPSTDSEGPAGPTPDTAELTPDRRRVIGYELLEELGRGGMGVVYKARQLSLNRVVALKMILAGPHARPQHLVRFRREAEAVARLQHPNIVQIFEVGESDGLPFFSLEYVEGGTLEEKLAGKPLPADDAARLLETLAEAVQVAHQAGVVHRDLKPANILLQTTDHTEVTDKKGKKLGSLSVSSVSSVVSCTPKITDFGLAKQLDSDPGEQRPTAHGVIMGTPGYMPPEQADGRNDEVGPAADVYALGAVLYECLTGRPPFLGARAVDVVLQTLTRDPVPVRQLAPKTPRDLETICHKCLQKEPARRYATAQDLADDLRRFREHKPVVARPVGAGERGAKWVRRHPTAAALVVVAAVSAASLAGLGLAWYAREVNESARRQLVALEKTVKAREALSVAQRSLAEGKYAAAEVQFGNVLDAAGEDGDLADVAREADQGLRTTRARLADQSALRRARDKYEQFRAWRDEALYHETLFTGAGPAARREATRRAARDALALYGLTPGGAGTPDFSGLDPLREEERKEVRSGCYELLLVSAEAAAREGGPEAARQALDVAESADRLRPPTKANRLRRARYLEQLGRDAEAREQRDRAAAQAPEGALDHFLAGLQGLDDGRADAAYDAFAAALREQPDHFWACYGLAVSCLRLERWGEAAGYLTSCIERERHFTWRQAPFTWPHLLRGFAHGQLKQNEAADADFREAERRARTDLERYGLLVSRGAVLALRGQAAEAERDLLDATRLKPGDFQAHLTLALAYEQMKKWDDALRHLDAAAGLQPKRAALYRTRARAHRQRGSADDEFADLGRAIEAERPGTATWDLADDHAHRGHILYQRKRYEDATREFESALKVRADYVRAYAGLGHALLALKNHEGAAAAFDGYLQQRPSAKGPEDARHLADAHRGRALALAKLDRFAEAAADYTLALKANPAAAATDRARLLAERGWTFLNLEAAAPARKDFEAAVKIDEAHAAAYTGLGHALLRLRADPADAVAAAENAANRSRDANVVFEAARVCALAYRAGGATQDRFRELAVKRLGEAMALRPAAERKDFWKKHVHDSVFAAVSRGPMYAELAREYGPPAR